MTRMLDPVLQNLRELVLRMGSRSEAILEKSLRAVLDRDAQLAREVQEDDLEIDRLDVEIDDAVLKALALQAPVAEDLREVVAIKMMASDLERVGDLARNIAKAALRFERHAHPPPQALLQLSRDTQRILRDALDAFSNADAEAARRVLDEDDRIDSEEDAVVEAALDHLRDHREDTSEGIDVILIAKNLERVADHATNIAEDVIYLVEGEVVRHTKV